METKKNIEKKTVTSTTKINELSKSKDDSLNSVEKEQSQISYKLSNTESQQIQQNENFSKEINNQEDLWKTLSWKTMCTKAETESKLASSDSLTRQKLLLKINLVFPQLTNIEEKLQQKPIQIKKLWDFLSKIKEENIKINTITELKTLKQEQQLLQQELEKIQKTIIDSFQEFDIFINLKFYKFTNDEDVFKQQQDNILEKLQKIEIKEKTKKLF